MAIRIEEQEGDDVGYLELVREIVSGALRDSRVEEVHIVRIDNWFDRKWLRFSGNRIEAQPEKGGYPWNLKLPTWRSEKLTLPPFSPNRVVDHAHYFWNGFSSEFVLDSGARVLHQYQESQDNLARHVTGFGSSTAFVWLTGNTELNGRGSLMVYLSRGGETDCWFASLVREEEWKVKTVADISLEDANGLADKGRELLREARERVLPEEEALSRKLLQAASQGELSRVSELIAGDVDLEGRDASGYTALLTALITSNWDCAELLLTAGANPYQQDYRGRGGLHHCCFGPESEPIVERLLKRLLERGVDVESRTETGLRPLMVAAWTGACSFARLLLEASADVSATDEMRWTALHLACVRDHSEMVRFLLEHGAKARARDKDRCTPMFVAAGDGSVDSIRVLHEAGASVELEDKHGRTPLRMARENGRSKAVELLRQLGARK